MPDPNFEFVAGWPRLIQEDLLGSLLIMLYMTPLILNPWIYNPRLRIIDGKNVFLPGRSLTVLLSWHSGLGNPKCILSSMIYYSEITVETPSRSHIHTFTMRFRSISSTRHPAFRQELCHQMLMQPNTVDQR